MMNLNKLRNLLIIVSTIFLIIFAIGSLLGAESPNSIFVVLIGLILGFSAIAPYILPNFWNESKTNNNTISNSIHVLQTENADNLTCGEDERKVYFLDSNGQVNGSRIAKIGSKVIVETQVIKNAKIKVFANGTEIPCSFSDINHCEYAFIMPNSDVVVNIVASKIN